jgi:alpha-L-arabinofuranosidase
VFYTYLDEWQQWFSRRRAKKEQRVAGVTPPPGAKLPGSHPAPAGAD